VENTLNAPGGSRNGSAKLGGWPGGVDLGTDLPGGPRTVLMYVHPSIELVDRPSKERER